MTPTERLANHLNARGDQNGGHGKDIAVAWSVVVAMYELGHLDGVTIEFNSSGLAEIKGHLGGFLVYRKLIPRGEGYGEVCDEPVT